MLTKKDIKAIDRLIKEDVKREFKELEERNRVCLYCGTEKIYSPSLDKYVCPECVI